MFFARLRLNSFIAAGRMEETSQQENKPELGLQNQNEEEGGIRRRLRDRDLLRKRKAEAEEKETNQAENQRKRHRAESKSGTKKTGRPRKAEPAPVLPAVLEGAAGGTQEDPAVVVAPEPAAAFISDQLYESLASIQASEPQLAPAPPAPMLQSVFVKSAVDLAPLPGPVDPAPLTAPGPSQDSVPTAGLAPPLAPPQVETLYTESQGREAPDQVLVEDLGPDEEEDVSPTPDQRPSEGLNETPQIVVPEQNKFYSVPTVSASLLPQEYFPGNSL
ncbi:formin-like protein 2 isoform X2 [Austrofundulus limnaeus]|uniref:Formin-like protein 2 isoform X2 n=1 Tax=Austrofundulus limnaeus TaxID=52670 RepID=A0A2I4D7Z0_AUSLI|nr:PREDICTED: formin-like protein 2 isoform X2 [Austrofundulus limnaeus]